LGLLDDYQVGLIIEFTEDRYSSVKFPSLKILVHNKSILENSNEALLL
jgi:hypothetical protein